MIFSKNSSTVFFKTTCQGIPSRFFSGLFFRKPSWIFFWELLQETSAEISERILPGICKNSYRIFSRIYLDFFFVDSSKNYFQNFLKSYFRNFWNFVRNISKNFSSFVQISFLPETIVFFAEIL